MLKFLGILAAFLVVASPAIAPPAPPPPPSSYQTFIQDYRPINLFAVMFTDHTFKMLPISSFHNQSECKAYAIELKKKFDNVAGTDSARFVGYICHADSGNHHTDI